MTAHEALTAAPSPQSGATVPACLHRDALGCLTRCLTLPLPYSAVAKRVLRSVRVEVTTPGRRQLHSVRAHQASCP